MNNETTFEKLASALPHVEDDWAYILAGMEVDIALQVTQAMKSAGVSAEELARRMGVRTSVVNRVLRHTGDVKLQTLARMSAALGRTPTFRLFEKGARNDAEKVAALEARIAELEARLEELQTPDIFWTDDELGVSLTADEAVADCCTNDGAPSQVVEVKCARQLSSKFAAYYQYGPDDSPEWDIYDTEYEAMRVL